MFVIFTFRSDTYFTYCLNQSLKLTYVNDYLRYFYSITMEIILIHNKVVLSGVVHLKYRSEVIIIIFYPLINQKPGKSIIYYIVFGMNIKILINTECIRHSMNWYFCIYYLIQGSKIHELSF